MTHAEKTQEIERLGAALRVALDGFDELRRYAQSRKFDADPMIHKGDVVLRVDEWRRATLEAMDAPSRPFVKDGLPVATEENPYKSGSLEHGLWAATHR